MTSIILSAILLIAAIVLFRIAKKQPSKTTGNRRNSDEGSSFPTGPFLKIVSSVCLMAALVIMVFDLYVQADSGTVKIMKIYGRIVPGFVPEGLHWANPIADYEEMNIQRNSISVDDNSADSTKGMRSSTADNIQAVVEANFTFMVNPRYAWWVRKYIGNLDKIKDELLQKAAHSATRDALAHYELEQAQISKRSAFEQMLHDDFKKNIIANLPRQEITEIELENVFIVLPTQLMNVIPDPKVANALSEKKASEINLQQQSILTKIADEVATRRGKEGKGIFNLFKELPKEYSGSDVAVILNATANKERADAQMKAVTDGKVSLIFTDGGGGNVSVKNQ